jgi:hypothetical protein
MLKLTKGNFSDEAYDLISRAADKGNFRAKEFLLHQEFNNEND